MPIDRFICLATGGGIMLALLFVGAHPIPQGWDKLAHFACFSVITALLWRGTAGRAPLIVLLSGVAVALLEDLHQILPPIGRGDVLDLAFASAAPVADRQALFDGRTTLCSDSYQ